MSVTLHAAIVGAAPAVWADSLETARSGSSAAYGVAGLDLGTLLATLSLDGFATPLAYTSATAWLPIRDGGVVGPPGAENSALADAGRVSMLPRTGHPGEAGRPLFR